MDELVNDFLVESHENLERLDRAFLTLERDPSAADVVTDVFRTIHTIKGTCGFLGFKNLERLSHGGESLLARVRDGERTFDGAIAQALFELVDAVRAILATVESTGAEGDAAYDDLIRELLALCDDERAPAVVQSSAAPVASTPAPANAPTSNPRDAGRADSAIRVDAGQLDVLMDLVGELVLAKNQIHAHAEHSTHPGLRVSSHRLAQLTSELQDGVMRTRMQPIGSVWTQVPRLLRDVSAELGKRVRLEVSGAKTPIDRGILEMLRDPLTHMVRNALDHGIETPARRAEQGKLPEGTLSIRASAAGGRVRLVVEDDGAGIDPERVRRKASERGVLDAASAARLSDAEAIALIFHPGFSTADKVSSLSGRGVGMDVVKTNIERLGGSVAVTSRPGRGTCIELSIPLTLAILSVVVLECAGTRFALPESSVLELARLPLPGEPGAPRCVQGARVLPLRGGLLPLIELADVLGLAPASGARHAIVLEADQRRFGLVVDALCDIHEIVVKPLGPALASLRVYSGATIEGDGRVTLILDVSGIAERGKLGRSLSPEQDCAREPSVQHAARQLLLLDVPGAGRAAIDLARVLRLEEIPREQVELADGRPVLRWRDEIVPLCALERAPSGSSADSGALQVVICDVGGRRVGFTGASILDVADEPLRRTEGALPAHVAERGILRDAVTDVLDVDVLASLLFEDAARAA
ncbi:MAG TPA: chemotaxis protein CheA [Planctomycetota bacterium]|nr:chemotaxis protein CheA [Planctomycetota bacterium]